MPSSQLHVIQNYLPAVVKQLPSLGFVVEYFIADPVTDKMLRKRIRLTRLVNRAPNKRQRLIAAQQVADNPNAKLRGGCSPIHETEDSRLYTPLVTLCREVSVGHLHQAPRPACCGQNLQQRTGVLRFFCAYEKKVVILQTETVGH